MLFKQYWQSLDEQAERLAAAQAEAKQNQWTAEECKILKKRQKEIYMARLMTREERIRAKLELNRSDNTSTALEQSEGYCAAFVDGEMAVEEVRKHSYMVNRKYEWATPEAKSDKQFLMWLWSRLHQVFGESENIGYMQRLDAIISNMPGNGRIDIADDGKFDIYRKGKLVHSDD